MIPKTKLSESEYQTVTTSVVQLCYCIHLYSKGSESMFLKFVAYTVGLQGRDRKYRKRKGFPLVVEIELHAAVNYVQHHT